MRFLRLLPAVLVLACCAVRSNGATIFIPTLDDLITMNDTVVIAAPNAAGTWTVEEVLAGDSYKKGDPIRFQVPASPKDFDLSMTDAIPFLPADITHAILFAPKGRDKENSSMGYRLLTRDGHILRAQGGGYSGSIMVGVVRGATWDKTVASVRYGLGETARVHDMLLISETGKRNAALLDWLKAHLAQVRDGFRTDSEAAFDPEHPAAHVRSWGDLPEQIHAAITTTNLPEDVWQAELFWREIHSNYPYLVTSPAWATPKGRELLLRVIADNNRPDDERILALGATQLDAFSAVDPASDPEAYRRDQKAYIARLLPLFESRVTSIKYQALSHILAASIPAKHADMRTAQALDALVAHYTKDTPSAGHQELAKAIQKIGGDDLWQQLSGNPHGVVVTFFLSEEFGKPNSFHGYMKAQAPAAFCVKVAPTAVATRMVDGAVVETVELNIPIKPDTVNKLDWATGWKGSDADVRLDGNLLRPGTWHIRIRGPGEVGDERFSWTSEPYTITVSEKKEK